MVGGTKMVPHLCDKKNLLLTKKYIPVAKTYEFFQI